MKRHAIYYVPPEDGFAAAAAAWLGWDAAGARVVEQPALPGIDLAALTAEPRRYGFHGTLKPPFRLAPGQDRDALEVALEAFAATRAPVEAGPLGIARLGDFLALVAGGPLADLEALAGAVVEAFEPFRAAPTEAEIARRRPERLTWRQRALLARYGYPFVLDEFRFHLTLTGALPAPAPDVAKAAEDWFAPWLEARFRVADICLFGEDEAGRFHLLSRHALTG